MGDFNDAIDGEIIVDLIRKNFNQEAFGRLTCKRWKDGIDIDHPTFAIEQFVRDIRALKRPEPDRSEVRERIARIIYERNPHYEPGEYVDGHQVSPGGDLSWEQASARDAEFGEDASFGLIVNLTKAPLELADAILSAGLVPDEAAIRADEREKCAKVAEQEAARWHDGSSARVAAANIRAGSGDGATIAAGHVSIPNDILLQARCPSDARQTIGECSNCGCSIGLYAIRNGGQK